MQNTISNGQPAETRLQGGPAGHALPRDAVYAKSAYRRFMLLDRGEQRRVQALVMGCAAGPRGQQLSGGMFSIEVRPDLRIVLTSNEQRLIVLAFTGEASR